jgi:hypothetical protein
VQQQLNIGFFSIALQRENAFSSAKNRRLPAQSPNMAATSLQQFNTPAAQRQVAHGHGARYTKNNRQQITGFQ